MSETETPIMDAPSKPDLDPAIAEILKLYGHRVESVTVSVIRGELRRETTLAFLSPNEEISLGDGLADSVNARMIRNMRPLVR